jgi:hypothetical protein
VGPTLVRSREALWRRLPDRLLVLSGGDEVLTLAGTAVAVWDELAEPIEPSELAARLADRFHADAAEVEADLERLLERLVAAGAVREEHQP